MHPKWAKVVKVKAPPSSWSRKSSRWGGDNDDNECLLVPLVELFKSGVIPANTSTNRAFCNTFEVQWCQPPITTIIRTMVMMQWIMKTVWCATPTAASLVLGVATLCQASCRGKGSVPIFSLFCHITVKFHNHNIKILHRSKIGTL